MASTAGSDFSVAKFFAMARNLENLEKNTDFQVSKHLRQAISGNQESLKILKSACSHEKEEELRLPSSYSEFKDDNKSLRCLPANEELVDRVKKQLLKELKSSVHKEKHDIIQEAAKEAAEIANETSISKAENLKGWIDNFRTLNNERNKDSQKILFCGKYKKEDAKCHIFINTKRKGRPPKKTPFAQGVRADDCLLLLKQDPFEDPISCAKLPSKPNMFELAASTIPTNGPHASVMRQKLSGFMRDHENACQIKNGECQKRLAGKKTPHAEYCFYDGKKCAKDPLFAELQKKNFESPEDAYAQARTDADVLCRFEESNSECIPE